MRKKPNRSALDRARYRNLVVRGGVIYYERVVAGRRFYVSAGTADWEEAAAFRDLYEREKGVARGRLPIAGRASTFSDLAESYLRDGTRRLAPTTREDREALLKEGGALEAHFGPLRIDAIGRRELAEWWLAEVEGRGRSVKTGRNYLDALSAAFRFAVRVGDLDANPVDAFRRTLERERGTKGERAASEPKARPIEDPAELAAFIEASRAAGGVGHVADLLQLDAGLRLGEALGLRWSDVRRAERELRIEEAVARGRHVGAPKSGRVRTVALSRRLGAALRERYLAVGRPDPGARVLGRLDPTNYRRRHFWPTCEAAKLGRRTPKDLRDTYASQLLTAGVQLGYVSRQLGHGDVAVTARHYARWCGGDAYRAPLELREGEVPADMLARISGRQASREQDQRGGG